MKKTNYSLEELINKNKGIITFEQVKRHNILYYEIQTMLKDGMLVKECSGIYHKPKIYVDEYFMLQYRYPKGIYSLDTALWLHGLSLTVPSKPIMSFLYGTNTKLIKENGIKPVVLRKNYEEGIINIKRHGNQIINIYEIERTLVECLRPIYRIDIQIITTAFKMYAQEHKINYIKLQMYAKMFKVESKVRSYLEVLD
ncbi:type IV toxin-antitoxin system AbiEi family antitoxin domain-containing protein [Breznakia pachnodae]|uniref:Abortive infection protein AbiGI n=1 Tax=Breznakia pachnodae TaxID=265178 RepID=A0ABU0E1J0_9FIRM|nr:type IV toxin-antitoxin system AbiEi family antitoxin domain-containing protein [Breznakia pachnodae]MDQ0360752.1 hypothetical protein [Breznakia pachnodae]